MYIQGKDNILISHFRIYQLLDIIWTGFFDTKIVPEGDEYVTQVNLSRFDDFNHF
jgi:hypothetical protein